MARIDKLLTKWVQNTPSDENKDTVISVLDRYFSGLYEFKTGSHIMVRHPDLIGKEGFGPQGDFAVIIAGGQRVKGPYLKTLGEVILHLGLREAEKAQKEREKEELEVEEEK
jgi:hypothetical protein